MTSTVPRPPPSSRRLHLRLWITYFLISGLCIALSTALEAVYQSRCRSAKAAWQVYEVAHAALLKRLGLNEDSNGPFGYPYGSYSYGSYSYILDLNAPGESLRRILVSVRQSLQPSPFPTRARVEQVLGPLEPCRPCSQDPKYLQCDFTDAQGVEFSLIFNPRRLCTITVRPGTFRDPTYPLQAVPLSEARQVALAYDAWVWALLLMLAVVRPRRRILWAELLVMVSITRILIRWPPLGGNGLSAYINAPFLPWALVMLSAAGTILAWAYCAGVAHSRVRCLVCEYNLSGCMGPLCPECGTAIPPEVGQRLHLRNQLRLSAATGDVSVAPL